ncbi:hypothetical protein [Jiella avicenniae]|uniref:Uncharacterized protein n=1 Tax=Jiella avicenniae TaxID=2907202 RepID=A0A9X1P462_9HYPH|nr:hypothetical protein [Jiella avicenniae]MCE7030113.1 hypothetical protein [Jiella avicenniae]
MYDEAVNWLKASGLLELTSILGFIVALIGFWFTIASVRKSGDAALRAEKAANAAREELLRIESFIDLSAVITAMETIKALHREQAWNRLSERYSEARRLLIQVRSTSKKLSTEQIQLVNECIGNFAALERQLDRYINDPGKINVSKANSIISDDIDQLVELLYALRGEEKADNVARSVS